MSTSKTICPVSTQTVSLFKWLKFLFYVIYTSIVISSLCELYCSDYVRHSFSFIHCVPSIMEFPLEDIHPHTSTLYFAHSFAHTRPNLFFLYSAPFAQATVYRIFQKLWFHKKFTHYARTQDLIVGVSVLTYDSGGGLVQTSAETSDWSISFFFKINIGWKNVKAQNGLGHRPFRTKSTQFVKHHTIIRCHVIYDSVSLNNPQDERHTTLESYIWNTNIGWKNVKAQNGLGHRPFLTKSTQFVKHHTTIRCHVIYDSMSLNNPQDERHTTLESYIWNTDIPPNYAVATLREVPSQNWVHIRSAMWRGSISITNSSTLESDRPQHDSPTACVIAQQYSSATLVSLRFHSRTNKSGAPFKIIIVSIFFTF